MPTLQSQDRYESDPRNGMGFAQFLPADQEVCAELPIQDAVTFDTAPAFLEQADASPNQSLLIEGGPGAGKSHLARDLLSVAILERRPVALWKLHIAAGKLATLSAVAEKVIEPLIERADERPVLVLDNVDFVGYKSKRTTHKMIGQRLDILTPFIEDATGRADLTVVGIGHTPDWRQENWQVQPEDAHRARQALETFPAKTEFAGEITPESSVRHLMRHGTSYARAKVLVHTMEEVTGGELLFRHIHHAPRYLSGLTLPTMTAVSNVMKRIDADTEKLITRQKSS